MDQIKTYQKKRVSIIIETPFLKRMMHMLDGMDLPGYTVLPALAGGGRSGTWRADALSSDAGGMAEVVIILDESKVQQVLETVHGVLKNQIGIVTFYEKELESASV